MPTPINPAVRMPLAARRVFRLSLSVALSLVLAYGLALPVPFLAPLMALMLGADPSPPPGPKKLLGLVAALALTLGTGLMLAPLLVHYPATALLLAAVGLYYSNYLGVHAGKATVATLLTAGITLISAAGTVSHALAAGLVVSMIIGAVLAVVCQWLVYPLFPENPGSETAAPAPASEADSHWLALRATVIVMPAFFFALINPALYMPLIMKSAALGLQGSGTALRNAGWELLGSTFLGGCFAVLLWFALGLAVNLWMFFLWMTLFGLYYGSKLYGVLHSRYPASFWVNTVLTMLIMLGPAVADSANGKDVYAAFAVRFGLFMVVTAYAWTAVMMLESLRRRRAHRSRLLAV